MQRGMFHAKKNTLTFQYCLDKTGHHDHPLHKVGHLKQQLQLHSVSCSLGQPFAIHLFGGRIAQH